MLLFFVHDFGVATVVDGSTTYCWGLNVAPSVSKVYSQSVFASDSGVNCPLAIAISTKEPIISIGERIAITWIVSSQNASSLDGTSSSNSNSIGVEQTPFTITHSAVHVCAHASHSPSSSSSSRAASDESATACDPFSADFQSANLSVSQTANLSIFSGRDTIRFRSINEVSFASAGEYTLAAYVVVPGSAENQRYDFVVYTRVQVLPDNTQVGAASDNENSKNKSNLPFNVSTWQFVLLCALLMFIVGCAIAVIVLVTKRRRLARQAADDDAQGERAKVSQTAALSPHTGDSQGQFRFSDWSEIYATQDSMPSSILMDDSNTIAILRASRVSSPAASAASERRIADFTREIGYWDVRPSASPITPLSSFFFPPSLHEDDDEDSSHREHERDCELASPMDSFVPLETLGRRRTRPCHADALDHEGLSDEDEEAQEVEF